MAAPVWKIGVDSTHLVAVRNPAQPTPAPGLVGGTRTSAGGSQTLQVVAKKWTTTWSWENIPTTDYLVLKAWWDGTNGTGPFAVVDPSIDPSTTVVRTMNITSFTPNPSTYFGLWSPEMVLAEV